MQHECKMVSQRFGNFPHWSVPLRARWEVATYIEEGSCLQDYLRPEWRGRELLHDIRDESEHGHTNGGVGAILRLRQHSLWGLF
jgi:hypothetical protein